MSGFSRTRQFKLQLYLVFPPFHQISKPAFQSQCTVHMLCMQPCLTPSGATPFAVCWSAQHGAVGPPSTATLTPWHLTIRSAPLRTAPLSQVYSRQTQSYLRRGERDLKGPQPSIETCGVPTVKPLSLRHALQARCQIARQPFASITSSDRQAQLHPTTK